MANYDQPPKPGNQYEQFRNDAHANDYGYNQPPNMAAPQVVVHPNSSVQTFTVETTTMPWSWCNLVTAMISFFCCTIFGFIATVMSILSYVDHKNKEYERARAKRSCAYGFGISGIVIGSILIILGIILYAALYASVAHEMYGN